MKMFITSFSPKHAFLAALLCAWLFSGCQKEIPAEVVETGSYLHVYPLPGNQQCQFARATEDNGILMLTTDDLYATNDQEGMGVLRISETGTLLSRYTVQAGTLYFPTGIGLDDGGAVVSAKGATANICKVNKNGDVEFLTKITANTTGLKSTPVQTEAEKYFLVGYSNGVASGSASINRLHAFTPDGTNFGSMQLQDSLFGFKMLYLIPYYAPSLYDVYCYGWYFPANWGGNWSSRRRLFVAHIVTNTATSEQSINILRIDTADMKTTQIDAFHCVTADHSLVMATTQTDENYRAKLMLTKVSETQQIVWRKELIAGKDGTRAWAIHEETDGTFTVTGECKVSGNDQVQPFATRLDATGNVIWTKVYSMPLAGLLSASIRLADGSFVFGGNTNGFGKSATQFDVFTLRTDNEGNLK